MAVLNREDFLKKPTLKRELVSIVDFGEVYVQEMTAKEADAFSVMAANEEIDREERLANFRAALCVRCIVDDGGKRMFSDSDVGLLGAFPASVITPIFNAAQRLNGMNDGAAEDAKKNSAAQPVA